MKNILIKGLFVSASVLFVTSSVSAMTCTNLTKNLSKGSENSEVLKLQQFLFDGGYLTAKPNGYFGGGTVTALKKFQGANGLSQVGSAGPATRSKIKEISCRSISSNGNTGEVSTIKQSITVDTQAVSLAEVKKEIEAELKSAGYNTTPLLITDSQSSGGLYSQYFDFSKVKTEDYFITVYSGGSGISGYNNYILYVGLGNRYETGKASFVFMDVSCDSGMEVKTFLGSDLCKKGGVSMSDFNINKNKSGGGKMNFLTKGTGKIHGDLFVSFVEDNTALKKPYVVIFKNITLDIQQVVAVTKTDKELEDDRNTQRLSDTKMIYTALVEYTLDNKGNFPTSIPSSPKEICVIGASSCEGLVDLSGLLHTYTYKIPIEVGKKKENGVGYKVSKIGDTLTVSAQYPENGKTIQTSCNFRKGGCTQ